MLNERQETGIEDVKDHEEVQIFENVHFNKLDDGFKEKNPIK